MSGEHLQYCRWVFEKIWSHQSQFPSHSFRRLRHHSYTLLKIPATYAAPQNLKFFTKFELRIWNWFYNFTMWKIWDLFSVRTVNFLQIKSTSNFLVILIRPPIPSLEFRGCEGKAFQKPTLFKPSASFLLWCRIQLWIWTQSHQLDSRIPVHYVLS
jgi:hypothetical protein